MMAPLTPVMEIGVGSFIGHWGSLISSVLEKEEQESGIQGLKVGIAGTDNVEVVVVAVSE